MNRITGFVATVAMVAALSACDPSGSEADNASNSESATPSPASSSASASTPSPSPSFALPSERIVFMNKLSLPMMDGWKKSPIWRSGIVEQVLQTKDCNANFDPQRIDEANCAAVSVGMWRPETSAEETLSFLFACDMSNRDTYVPVRPVGTDTIGGVTMQRYRMKASDCPGMSEDRRDMDSTVWAAESRRLYVVTTDGINGAPKFNLDKLRFALAHAEWVN